MNCAGPGTGWIENGHTEEENVTINSCNPCTPIEGPFRERAFSPCCRPSPSFLHDPRVTIPRPDCCVRPLRIAITTVRQELPG